MNLENVKLNINTSLVLNVGFPMGKTNAPRVYNKLFSLLDMNAIMLPVEIQKGCLKEFMAALKTLNIRYFCTTMPHKADIIDYLDEVDEDSRCFKSVNAVRIDENGKSHGIGMDGKGAVGALLRSGVELSGREALMLGSGGVSGVIGLELAKRGVKKLTILNRTEDKAREIACVLNKKTKMEVQYGLAEPARLDAAAKTADPLPAADSPGHGRIRPDAFLPRLHRSAPENLRRVRCDHQSAGTPRSSRGPRSAD